MATVQITIPQDLIVQARNFATTIQKFQAFANQLQQSMVRQAPTNIQVAQTTGVRGQYQRLLHVLNKMQSSLTRALASTINLMGPIGKAFMRTLTWAAEAIAPILAMAVTVGSYAITAVANIAMYSARFIRWIWDKMVDFGDSLLADWMMSSGMLASIGGLRAYRTAFGRLPEDPAMYSNVQQARGSATSM